MIHDNFLLVSFSVMSSRIRRHPSGHEKQQNKKKVEERLSELAIIAIENDILEKVFYEELIKDFISRNVRMMSRFF